MDVLLLDESNLVGKILRYILLGPVFPFLQIGHAIYVYNSWKPLLKDKPWLLSLVICVVHLFFGSTMRYLILGMRPGVLENNVVAPSMIALWFIVWYCPGDFVLYLYKLPPIKALGRVIEFCYKTRTITQAVRDTVGNLENPAILTVVLIGTLGGSLWKNLIMKTVLHKDVPSDLSKLTPGAKVSFYVAAFYYFSTDPRHLLFGQFLSHETAMFYLITYMSVYGLTTIFYDDHVPVPFNILEWVVGLLCSPFSVVVHEESQPKDAKDKSKTSAGTNDRSLSNSNGKKKESKKNN